MAIINSDGSLYGKHGNSVYYTRKGKKVVRSYVAHNPSSTPKQLKQRARFRAVSSFLKPFKKLINLGYQGQIGHDFPMNEAISYHLRQVLEDITPVSSDEPLFVLHPEQVRLSRGTIQSPEILTCSRVSNKISLTWISELGERTNRWNDIVALVAFIPGTLIFANYHVGEREAGNGSATLPLEMTEPAHTWVFFWNGQKSPTPGKENVSDSVYLGKIL